MDGDCCLATSALGPVGTAWEIVSDRAILPSSLEDLFSRNDGPVGGFLSVGVVWSTLDASLAGIFGVCGWSGCCCHPVEERLGDVDGRLEAPLMDGLCRIGPAGKAGVAS